MSDDGFDYDTDGACDLGDTDDDNDGAHEVDSDDNNEHLILMMIWILVMIVQLVHTTHDDDLIMIQMECAMQVTLMMIMMEHLMM